MNHWPSHANVQSAWLRGSPKASAGVGFGSNTTANPLRTSLAYRIVGVGVALSHGSAVPSTPRNVAVLCSSLYCVGCHGGRQNVVVSRYFQADPPMNPGFGSQ